MKKCVRLHSGDPSLYGAIVEQIEKLESRGIETEIVPGVSSLFAAAAALKTQLTLRGVSESLIVTRPAGKTLKEDQIGDFSRLNSTMVIFLGTEKLAGITKKLACPRTPLPPWSTMPPGPTRSSSGARLPISRQRHRPPGSNTRPFWSSVALWAT